VPFVSQSLPFTIIAGYIPANNTQPGQPHDKAETFKASTMTWFQS
jgi:hypothetical protein